MMKDIFIDNRKELVMVDGKVVPRILLRMMRGAVGRSFVVKRYCGGRMVVTQFPDMSGIVATEKQKVRRDLFREAVVFARWIIADEGRKLAFKRTLPRKKRRKVYQAALQLYMRKKGNKLWVSKVLENMEKQGLVNFVDIRKQLAAGAMIYAKREAVNADGRRLNGFERKEHWRVLWQKKIRNHSINREHVISNEYFVVERA